MIEKSDHPFYQMGAVIFKGSRILSYGHNGFRSSTIPLKYKKFEHTVHAEQSALNGVNWKTLKNASILVMRMNISGNISMAYPCDYCKDSIRYVGIKHLYYSNRNGEIIKEKI